MQNAEVRTQNGEEPATELKRAPYRIARLPVGYSFSSSLRNASHLMMMHCMIRFPN